MVLLRFLNFLCLCSGMSLRILCHVLFISWMVQCFLGLPTRLLRAMFGLAVSPVNVAFLVGVPVGSLSVCRKRVCCALLICVDTFSIRLRGWCLPIALAARFRTRLLVFLRSMKVVCILRIFLRPLSWKVSSLCSCFLVRYMVSKA